MDYMDFRWSLLGVYKESTRSTWSLHGVHKDLWGSVKYSEFILENLQTGCIHPPKSPMASPVFFIKKKDGGLHIIQNYGTLNAMTVKNHYPLPLISDLINQLHDARYFTKLDM